MTRTGFGSQCTISTSQVLLFQPPEKTTAHASTDMQTQTQIISAETAIRLSPLTVKVQLYRVGAISHLESAGIIIRADALPSLLQRDEGKSTKVRWT